jgi:hypothetical protein
MMEGSRAEFPGQFLRLPGGSRSSHLPEVSLSLGACRGQETFQECSWLETGTAWKAGRSFLAFRASAYLTTSAQAARRGVRPNARVRAFAGEESLFYSSLDWVSSLSVSDDSISSDSEPSCLMPTEVQIVT